MQYLEQEALKEPLKRMLLDVAKQHFRENLATFHRELEAGEQDKFPGGTAAEYMDALTAGGRTITIKEVQAELGRMAKLGFLKKGSDAVVRPLKRAKQTYFIPDSDIL